MGRMLRGRSWTGIRGWKRDEEWLVLKQKPETKKSNEDQTKTYAAVIASNHLSRRFWPWSDHIGVWQLQNVILCLADVTKNVVSRWLYPSRGRLHYIPQRRS